MKWDGAAKESNGYEEREREREPARVRGTLEDGQEMHLAYAVCFVDDESLESTTLGRGWGEGVRDRKGEPG